jgi:hypothetical protein
MIRKPHEMVVCQICKEKKAKRGVVWGACARNSAGIRRLNKTYWENSDLLVYR